jgi:hypothetical protein
MRRLAYAVVAIAMLVSGCGGDTTTKTSSPSLPAGCKTFATRGDSEYFLCFVGNQNDHGRLIVRSGGDQRAISARTPPETLSRRLAPPVIGHWQSASLSPDGATLLLTWSGECEIPRAFFLSVSGGTPRSVSGKRNWVNEPDSIGLGWQGPSARVLLPRRGETIVRRPGVYLVDPDTFRMELVQAKRGRPGC